MDENNNDNIIINHKQQQENKQENQTQTTDNSANINKNLEEDKEKFYLNIKVQTKVFSVLLMFFSALLFIALISYTAQDEANTQIHFLDLFNMFSDDPVIKFKFDTTLNLLGLLGAYISSFLINGTIGYLIIGLPIFLFIWARNLYKIGEVPEKLITQTNIYLIFSIGISFFIANLTLFSTFENIPKEFYGTIGLFIPSIIARLLSPIGTLILTIGFLILLIYKLTSIKKIGLKKTFQNIAQPFNIKRFIAKLNDSLNKPDEIKEESKPQNNVEYTEKTSVQSEQAPVEKVNSTVSQVETNSASNEAQTSSPTLIINEPQRHSEENTTKDKPVIKNIFDENKLENPFNKSNPILSTKTDTGKANNTSIEDELLEQFRTKTKIKIIEEPNNQNSNATENIEQTQENSNIKVEDIELPKPNVYIPDENNNFSVQSNPPITIDLTSNPQTNENQENTQKSLVLDVDTPAMKQQNEVKSIQQEKIKINAENTDNQTLKNPLSVGSLEENIHYKSPQLNLLDVGSEVFANDEELQRNGKILQETLKTFKIDISNLEVTRGPVVTQYEFELAAGIAVSKVENLAANLTMALKAKSIRILAPVPEKGTIGIQIPNSNPSTVRFHNVIASEQFAASKFELPLALGKTVAGEPLIADLAKMPHLLIAGSTGSGKSVGINTIITSLLYKKHPKQLKFIIVDPKKVELQQYSHLSNHFIAISPEVNSEIVTDSQDAITVLKAAVLEMEKRYDILAKAGQRNIKDYNEKVRKGELSNNKDFDHRELPYIVVVIDELADLMLTAGKEVETPIVRLAQMARAIGIHLIIATQRPSVNVITGVIKANFPARIGYLVAQKVDSRTILDSSGAETLLGNGDMLFQPSNQPKPIRLQNPFISTDEVDRICNFIGEQEGYSEPYMLPSIFEEASEGELNLTDVDPLFREAAELVIEQQQASTSMLQRRLKIGFARAGRIIDELETAKIIGKSQGSKPREVFMESASELEQLL